MAIACDFAQRRLLDELMPNRNAPLNAGVGVKGRHFNDGDVCK